MKILMIGNSATYYNDVPGILSNLISENGIDAVVHSATKGGARLSNALSEETPQHEKLCSLLSENKYDVLFLQEHGIHGIIDTDGFTESAAMLCNMVKAPRTILYVPCARKEGNEAMKKRGWTAREMTEKAYNAYVRVANEISAELSPATVCFMNILENHPDAPLHAEDMAHPSLLGSCVIATTLYRTLIGKMPTEYSSVECARPYFDIIDSTVEEYGK